MEVAESCPDCAKHLPPPATPPCDPSNEKRASGGEAGVCGVALRDAVQSRGSYPLCQGTGCVCDDGNKIVSICVCVCVCEREREREREREYTHTHKDTPYSLATAAMHDAA